MPRLAHAHLTAMSIHVACRIWLVPIAWSRLSIEHVAFSSCLCDGHVAHLIVTSTHEACAYPTVMSIHVEHVSYSVHAHLMVTSANREFRI